jgi:hypothetical protein
VPVNARRFLFNDRKLRAAVRVENADGGVSLVHDE